MGPTRQRLMGSVGIALAGILLVFWRDILAGRIDLGGIVAGLTAGFLVAYRAWPALDFAPWRRRKW